MSSSEKDVTSALLAIQDLIRCDLVISVDRFRRALVAHFGLRPYPLDQAATLYCLLLLEQQGYARRMGRDGAGNILWGATRRAERDHDYIRPRT